MSQGASALVDVERLRQRTDVLVGPRTVQRHTLVLGSSQPLGDLDLERVEEDGLVLRRRRGGGGAVLLRPGDCWVETWLPSWGARLEVRADAIRAGEWWARAFASLGIDALVHTGGLTDPLSGAVACFAGLGPGEVTVEGRKVLGLSQWRSKQGVLVSSVVPAAPPGDLATYLSMRPVTMPMLTDAPGLHAVDPDVTSSALVDAFVRSVRAEVPAASIDADAFL